VYKDEIAKTWSAATPGLPTDPRHLPTEKERWALLTQRPLFMTDDILQYGPLTDDGYLAARRTLRGRDHFWPVEPATIAKVLVTCGLNVENAGYVAIEHVPYMPHNDTALATSLLIHLEILNLLNTQPNSTLLLEAISDVRWGTSETDEYPPLLGVINRYLLNEDPAEFLCKWLPALEACDASYGSESLGLALVQAFPTCHPTPLIEWCKKNDDQQALGYLVWQSRLSFKEWLAEAADPAGMAASRRRHGEDYQARRIEQTATLHQLIEKLPSEQLQQGCKELFAEQPEAIVELMLRTKAEPSSTDSIAWVACLTRIGALTAEHPLMLDWLERAHTAQLATLGQKIKNGSHVESSLYRDLFSAFATHGSRPRNLIARHMALHMYGQHFHADDIGWLTVSSISSILCALPSDKGKGIHPSVALLFSLLCNEDKAVVATHIMRSAMKDPSSAKGILDLLRQGDFKLFAGASIVVGNEVMSLLSAITQKDIQPLTNVFSVLAVHPSDPMFATSIENFVQSAFVNATEGPGLPELETSESRTYLS
jgi:hypothetical protein